MKDGFYKIAIVGASTLKGRELAEVLNESDFPAHDVCLLDDEQAIGKIEAVGDEASFVLSVSPNQFEGVDFAFFASSEDFTRKHWKTARQSGAAIVDLSYALEVEPGFAVRAPWIEQELGIEPPADEGVVCAHPAAVVIALLLARAHRAARVRNAVCTVFEPASEQGQPGMDELHEQTVNLLSLKEIPAGIFDAQAAFNMLSRYGEQSARNLEEVEARIVGHLQAISGGRLPVSSLVLLQAPIFHAHTFSVYVELEDKRSAGDFLQALDGPHVSVARLAAEAPTNVRAAGQNDILVSARRDAARESAFWLFAAADNLRVAALTAVEGARSLATARKGTE